MDEIDYLILGDLLLDSQTAALQIAKKIKISSYTVKSRYDKMTDEGIIHGAIININLSKLGYQGKVYLLITNLPNQPKEKTIKELKKMRNILVVSEIIGTYDVIAIAPIIDFKSIRELVNQVKKLPSVQYVNIACTNDTSFPFNSSYGKLLSKTSLDRVANLKEQTLKRKNNNGINSTSIP